MRDAELPGKEMEKMEKKAKGTLTNTESLFVLRRKKNTKFVLRKDSKRKETILKRAYIEFLTSRMRIQNGG